MPNVDASVLESLPISGEMPEYWYDAVGKCTFVKFQFVDAEFQFVDRAVLGIFGSGPFDNSTSSVVLFDGGNEAFVSAAGQGYIIELQHMKLLQKTKCDLLTGIFVVPGSELVLASTFQNLILFNRYEAIWESDSIEGDDLKVQKVTTQEVIGEYHQYRWIVGTRKFRMDIGAITRNWLLKDRSK